jgi:hypothetical protein
MQLFDRCSYDMDRFREFIQAEGCRSMFDVEDVLSAAIAQRRRRFVGVRDALPGVRRYSANTRSRSSKAHVNAALRSARKTGRGGASKKSNVSASKGHFMKLVPGSQELVL